MGGRFGIVVAHARAVDATRVAMELFTGFFERFLKGLSVSGCGCAISCAFAIRRFILGFYWGSFLAVRFVDVASDFQIQV